jgi:hypothetical protein
MGQRTVTGQNVGLCRVAGRELVRWAWHNNPLVVMTTDNTKRSFRCTSETGAWHTMIKYHVFAYLISLVMVVPNYFSPGLAGIGVGDSLSKPLQSLLTMTPS